ncbi:unnamed protein product, partial [Amoebophrya sp. A25]
GCPDDWRARKHGETHSLFRSIRADTYDHFPKDDKHYVEDRGRGRPFSTMGQQTSEIGDLQSESPLSEDDWSLDPEYQS